MNQLLSLDLNCDAGESFGAFVMGHDEAILPLVSSVNIACGYHGGDPLVMQKTVNLALQHGVAIGAHPGLPDLAGFGRREMAVTPAEVYALMVYQVGALAGFVRAAGGVLHHVKPHGALYNQAAVNPLLADAIAEAVYHTFPEAILYGLAHSELIKAGNKIGLQTANEVFADRTYQPDGTLTSRRQPHALITDARQAAGQVIRMVKEGKVQALNGEDLFITADTVCIHGDGENAVALAREIRKTLEKAGIVIGAKKEHK